MIVRILGVDSQKITMGNCEECMAMENLEALLGFDVRSTIISSAAITILAVVLGTGGEGLVGKEIASCDSGVCSDFGSDCWYFYEPISQGIFAF